MSKQSRSYVCENCGVKYTGWQGQCNSCGEWNTIVEQKILEIDTQIISRASGFSSKFDSKTELKNLEELGNSQNFILEKDLRIPTGISEFDRVLGGNSEVSGLVKAAAVLLTGEPGIGKSTLLSQVGLYLAENHQVIYISAEESMAQISLRISRLSKNIKLSDRVKQNFEIMATGNLEKIQQLCIEKTTVKKNQTEQKTGNIILMIDSIQTLVSNQISGIPGGMAQVRYCTSELISLAKGLGITLLIVGHINKEGDVAGPKILEHLVDVVLQFEGDEKWGMRTLRALKNRFGSTDEIGLFIQLEQGLVPIINPVEFFAGTDSAASKESKKPQIGSCKTVVMEGKRPLVLEIQVLATKTDFAYPKRVSEGIPLSRLQLLTAIAAKYLKLNLHEFDVYLSVANGFKISDRSADLAILIALVSSVLNKSLSSQALAFGEVNLSGMISPGIWFDRREKETKKFHYELVLDPRTENRVIDVLTLFKPGR